MEKILIFLILAIFPFGQLTKLPLGIPEVNVYLQDLLISGLVIIWLIRHIMGRISFNKPPLAQPILLFFTVALMSLLVNLPRLELRQAIVASFYLWRWIFYAGIYFVVYDISISHIWRERLRWGLVLAGTATAVFGLGQYFLYPDLRNLAYLGWDPHKYRIFGTFFDPGFLGMILVLTMILIISFLLGAGGDEFFHPTLSLLNQGQLIARSNNPGKGAAVSVGMSKIVTHRLLKYTFYFILATCYFALALTYSRSSYLAYLVGIGVIAWIKKSIRFFLIMVLLGILTILVLPRPPGSEGVNLKREESAWGRVKNWQESLVIAKDHPVLGVGFNAYRYAQRQYGFLSEEDWQESHAGAGADSSLLFVLATTGIIGFLSYAWLLYHILIYNVRSVILVASLAALLVHSWFSNSLFYPWIMLWMWILVASRERK